MITSMRLINWKSFADATLYFDPLTILIGANSSGKSNILDALEFIRRISSGVDLDKALAGSGSDGLPPLRGGRSWAAKRGTDGFTIMLNLLVHQKEYAYQISVETKDNNLAISEEALSCVTTNTPLISLIGEHDDARDYRLLSGGSTLGSNISQSFLSFMSHMSPKEHFKEYVNDINCIRDELSNLFPFKPMPNNMRMVTPLSDSLRYDGSNIAGFLANHTDKEKIEHTLSKYIRDLPEGDVMRVWTEIVGRTEEKAELYCEERWGNNGEPTIVDANNMSEGTLRFISILIAILSMKPDTLIAIEELDNGLHPSRAKLLVQGLKELGKQQGADILAVTHNPALLDALGTSATPFISVVHRDSKGGSNITLLEDIKQLPKLMASGPLGSIVSQGKIQKALQEEG